MVDQRRERLRISIEIWGLKLKQYAKMLVTLSGFAVLFVGVYGMFSLGWVPALESVAVPEYAVWLRSLAVELAGWWFISIPLGAAIAHFSMKF